MNQCGGEILINFWFKIPLQIRYLWGLSAGVKLWSRLMPQVTLSTESHASAISHYPFVSENVLTSLKAILFAFKKKWKDQFPSINVTEHICCYYSFYYWRKEWSAKRLLTRVLQWTILDTSLCTQHGEKCLQPFIFQVGHIQYYQS